MNRDLLYIVAGAITLLLIAAGGFLVYDAGSSATKQAQLELQVKQLTAAQAQLERDQLTIVSAFTDALHQRDLQILALNAQVDKVTELLATTVNMVQRIAQAIDRYQTTTAAPAYYGGPSQYSAQTVAVAAPYTACWAVNLTTTAQVVVCQNR